MAIGDTKSTTLASGWTLTASFEETGTSIQNNTSSIKCSAKLSAGSAYSFSYSAGAGKLYIYWHDNKTGRDTLVTSSTIYSCNSSTPRTVSGTINATHKDDGTLSGYAKAVWDKTHSSSYVPPDGNVSTSTKALTTIARKSVPTLSDNAINIPASAGSITVNTNRKSSTFTHTIKLKIGDTEIAKVTGVTTSVTFAIPDIQGDIFAEIPDSRTATITVVCETWNNSTSLGTNSVNFTANVTDDARPTFSDFTYADTNAATTTLTGNDQVLISGKSTLTAYISAAQKAVANYDATMNVYTFTINEQSASEAYTTSAITKNLGTVTLGGTITENTAKDLVVAAIDSRGLSASVTKTVTVIPYRTPIINASAARQNGFENTTTITIGGNVSPLLVNGTGKNSVNATSGLQYRYKSQNTTTWGAWTNIATTYDASTGAVSASSFTLNLDNQTAYDFEFQLTDALETATASITVSQGQPAVYIDAEDKRMSVGGMPTVSKATGKAGQLEVLGNAYANGERLIQSHVGQVIFSTTLDTAAKVAEIYGGTWTQIKDTFIIAAGDTYAAGSTGGSATHSHTLDKGYAKIILKAANKIAYQERQVTTWQDNYTNSTGAGSGSSASQNYGANLGGTTDDGSSIPPYVAVYIWQRTA